MRRKESTYLPNADVFQRSICPNLVISLSGDARISLSDVSEYAAADSNCDLIDFLSQVSSLGFRRARPHLSVKADTSN
jgi:hypothetical protein